MRALLREGGWRAQAARGPGSAAELAQRLELGPQALRDARRADDCGFALRVPQDYVQRMVANGGAEALARQVLPHPAEARGAGAERLDPLGERARQPVPGIVSKYRGRVLWMLTGACAIHCRYCFRRHLPYADMAARRHPRQQLDWLRSQPQVSEVILSGGDPLALDDAALAAIAQELASLPQLRSLRIHTRLPVVLPSRVDAALLAWLRAWPRRLVVVLHLNHPSEVDGQLRKASAALRGAGALLYAQTVLLRGVNDDAALLGNLCEALLDAGIQPYYLHLLDPVRGAGHFDIPEWRARRIYGQLLADLPGYAAPRLVRETQGLPAKSLVPPSFP